MLLISFRVTFGRGVGLRCIRSGVSSVRLYNIKAVTLLSQRTRTKSARYTTALAITGQKTQVLMWTDRVREVAHAARAPNAKRDRHHF